MVGVVDVVFYSVEGVFDVAAILFDAFDFSSFMLGIVFLLLVSRFLLNPIFKKGR